jgi:type IV pilus assembly protein PilE
MSRRNGQAGVTLIELMIVVALVAVLASIALPSYRSYVIRTHRTEATALLGIAAAQEKFYLANNRYAEDDELEAAPPAGLGIEDTTENGWYTLAITAADTETFTAEATAVGGQAEDSHCALFTLNAVGEKDATNDDCWNR